MYHKGEKVVDLWGGVRNHVTGERWEEDTMALVYSATKGPAAMTLAVAHSRGWLDYDELVCKYWPEFAQKGKEKITVRQLLAHQAGLFALDQPLDRSLVADLDRLADVLARQKPDPRSNIRRALLGSELAHDKQSIYPRNLEIPAGGGVGTARALAHAYSAFATGGEELGLRPATLQELMAPAVPATHGFYDECMKDEVQFSLGFMKLNLAFPFGGPSPSSFGGPGAGGSLGFADPEAKIGYGYIPNRKSVALDGDPRDVALRRALYSATPAAQSG